MGQVTGFLLPKWETQIEFPTPAFVLAQPQLLENLGNEPVKESMVAFSSMCVLLSLVFILFLTYLCPDTLGPVW